MRLIDADALKDMGVRYFYMPGDQNSHLIKQWMKVAINNCIALLDKAPTIDAVEVVRCKDCKSCWVHEPTNTHFCFLRDEVFRTMPTDFCNYGERK